VQAFATQARDVLIQPSYRNGMPLAVVVGSTNDPGLLQTLTVTSPAGPHAPVLGPQTTIGTGADGFVFACHLPLNTVGSLGTKTTPIAATFSGAAGDDGLTGVAGWNEFTDHFTVVGYNAAVDIDVAGYVIDSQGLPSAQAAQPMLAMTRSSVGGTQDDSPADVGPLHCLNTTTGLVPWVQSTSLRGPAGGGITVDASNRVNVVGSTLSADYPVTSAGLFPAGRAPVLAGFIRNGIRTVVDLLPPGVDLGPNDPLFNFHVGRTDGTGVPAPGGPAYPPAGWFGGTTPECALNRFGSQIGIPTPPLSLRRMLIDCHLTGLPNGSVQCDLVVTRTLGSVAQLAAWHLGFPGVGTPPTPTPLPGGALLWANNSPATFALPGTDETLVNTFLLPGSATFTVQLVVLPLSPVGGGALGPAPCPGTSDFAASPGLWFSY